MKGCYENLQVYGEILTYELLYLCKQCDFVERVILEYLRLLQSQVVYRQNLCATVSLVLAIVAYSECAALHL